MSQSRLSDSAARPYDASRAAAIHLLVFLSGFAALVYEISWTRQLGGVFGQTSHAAAVVLASYFGGMAAGYVLGSRWSRRMSPLRGYAAAELVLAVWALAVPALLRLLGESAFTSVVDGPNPVVATVFRVLLTLLVLGPATVAMGTTLPFLAAHFAATTRESAAATSSAYAWNTLGAFAGIASMVGFLLIRLGVEGSGMAAAALSILCAAGGMVLSRTSVPLSDASSEPLATSELLPVEPKTRVGQAAGIAALSGFVTLALEVLYTRLFSLVFHNSTQTFALVVAVFLFGLSLGAFFASRLGGWLSAARLVQWGLLAGAVSIPLSVIGFVWWTGLDYVRMGPTFSAYLVRSLTHVVAVVLVPATVLGVVLPAAWRLAGNARLAETVGRLTMANTLAAAAGALSASFVLLPALGLWKAFALLGCAAAAGTLLVAGTAPRRPVFLCTIAGLATLPLWLREPPRSADGTAAARGFVERWSAAERGETLLRRWETPYGWIDLTKHDTSKAYRIRQNLHYSYGSSGDDVSRERRQAHLPLLLHPEPHDVLFLGLGTGITASGVIPHPEIRTATAVELIPEVATAARILAELAGRPLDDPRLSIEVEDARHFLRKSRAEFDVIVSDLFVPWESTTGYLYTVEHYRAARARLRPGGLFCQWLALYQVGEPELELIADSLASVFPHVTLWWGRLSAERPIIALVGSDAPLVLESSRLDPRLAAIAANPQYRDEELASATRLAEVWIGDWPRPEGAALLNTEEFPRVEFSSPASHGNRRMLSGRRLASYLDRRLLGLPRAAVEFRGAPEPREVRWQRTVLFPEVP